MNDEKAPFDDLKVRQAVNYAVDPAALERIYAGSLAGHPPDPAARHARLREVRPLPAQHGQSQGTDRGSQPVGHATSRSGPTTKAPTTKPGAYYQDVLKKLGFNAKLKTINADNYFTVIGNETTPDLDTGWIRLVRGLPEPERLLPAAAGRRKHPADQQHELPRIDDPGAEREDRQARRRAARPRAGSRIRGTRQGIHGTGALGPLRDRHDLDLRHRAKSTSTTSSSTRPSGTDLTSFELK